ncbi:hypothetical protein ACHAWO_010469 [Cyclotella atomus]|uniref:Uncharacterized protein n=1 Tax=Cyclotella atomus TaxID=382360 RepID=A0ABD3NPR4_9STRA
MVAINSNVPAGISSAVPAVDNTDGRDDEDSLQTNQAPPLYESPRLKGYITLLSSSVYNYISAKDQTLISGEPVDWCLAQYDLSLLTDDPRPNAARIRYAMTAAVITIMITCAVIFIHFISFTGIGNKLWLKMFGRNGKAELYIASFLTFLWIITTWSNTSIRGPAGYKDNYNLYWSTWICCFTSFWILEAWSTSTGRASSVFQYQQTVSLPPQGPMWIVTFILAFTDFVFALDASRNWEDGLEGYPYTRKYFSRVRNAEWVLLIFVTAATFACSLAWVLAEIFRENKTNRMNTKSDQENHVEGIMIHLLTAIWVPTVFIVTVPGGAASLLGNMYFTTWSCSFAVVGLLVWWQRQWREGIFEMIEEQQHEYDKARRAIRRREEKRLANIEEQEHAEDNEDNEDEANTTRQFVGQESEQSESFDDEDVNSEDDIQIVDDDDYSIPSTSSVTSVSPISGARCSSRSLFASALSSLPPHREED